MTLERALEQLTDPVADSLEKEFTMIRYEAVAEAWTVGESVALCFWSDLDEDKCSNEVV